MGEGRQQRQPTPEEMAQWQEADRQWRLEWMPSQVDVNGVERVCVYCRSVLNPIHNRNYDGTIGGFCNKLCAMEHEDKMMEEGMSEGDAAIEVEKYEGWKPKRQTVAV